MISTIDFLYFESNDIVFFFFFFITGGLIQNTWSLFSSHK